MVVVIYKWAVTAGCEQAFTEAWATMTNIVRDRYGGLGSRLHKDRNGNYVAYAQWPDMQTLQSWRNRTPTPDEQALNKIMSDGTSTLDREEMTVLVDMLEPSHPKRKRNAGRLK